MQPVIIRLENISREYKVGTETIHALRSITLDISKNEYVALMGSSGWKIYSHEYFRMFRHSFCRPL